MQRTKSLLCFLHDTRRLTAFNQNYARHNHGLGRSSCRWLSSSNPRSGFYITKSTNPLALASDESYNSSCHRDNYPESTIKTWHTTELPLPAGWSCDWKKWSPTFMGYSSLEYRPNAMEQRLNVTYRVPGTIVPLAYTSDRDVKKPEVKTRFAFEANGRYFFCISSDYFSHPRDSEELYSLDATFVSHDDCLRRLWDGTVSMTRIFYPADEDWEDKYGGNLLDEGLLDPSIRAISPPRRYLGLASVDALTASWYRPAANSLPAEWSTDWRRWTAIRQFFIEPSWYSLSPADILLKIQHWVPGAVTPLAYHAKGTEITSTLAELTPWVKQETYLFEADGVYYYVSGEDYGRPELYRYKGRFEGREDFFQRVRGAKRVRVKEREDYHVKVQRIEAEQKTLRTADWLRMVEGRSD
ncbi:hypothetical protein C8R43DRAFT_1111807 [Mycena crocata]|nr:hypothetical protein C8R43DRAFT_1111807 [Mycena crocata]